jgi:hypothetical protein
VLIEGNEQERGHRILASGCTVRSRLESVPTVATAQVKERIQSELGDGGREFDSRLGPLLESPYRTAVRAIAANVRESRLPPPTSAPSTFGHAKIAAASSGFTDPP